MKDELWMRTWTEGHPQFSDDLHRGLLWVVARFRAFGARINRRAIQTEPAAQRDAV